MKVFAFSLFITGALGALAAFDRSTPIKRQLGCQLGEVVCGYGCLPIGYKCCGDQQTGCPLSSTCQVGNNGEYGCCPLGRTCIGDGGATGGSTRTIFSTLTSTAASTRGLDITSTISSDITVSSATSAPQTPSSSAAAVPSSSHSALTPSVPSVIPSSNGTATSSTTIFPTAGAAINAASLFGAVAAGAAAWML